MITQNIGIRIKHLRNMRQMTQTDLAVVIGKDRSVIARYEQGGIDIPLSVLEQIANALKIKMSDLLKAA